MEESQIKRRNGAWDEEADFVIVGSGGGSMCAALVCADVGRKAVILEKTDKVGGSTAMSGGILWIPNNPVMKRAGVKDSFEQGLAYLEAVAKDAPGSSPERKRAFLEGGARMVEFLQRRGLRFVYCDGWSDYYDELPGGVARGRSIGMKLFDVRRLGPWKDRLRRGPFPYPVEGNESQRMMLARKTLAGFWLAARVAWRMFVVRLFGKELAGAGAAIQGRMLEAALTAGVDIRTEAPVVALVYENGRVEGVAVDVNGRERYVRARDGVLINAGGFARNAAMRQQYGPQPSSVTWTHSNPGDTGEMIDACAELGAGLAQMDQAVWIPTSILPNGRLAIHSGEMCKPHGIMVDRKGARFTDEAGSYVETGQRMYAAGAVPCWAILDSRHRSHYNWAKMPPGINPPEWFKSGYLKRADSLEGLAVQCGIDPASLRGTVERFNNFARAGQDDDFGRGGRSFDRYWGDPTHGPNPSLGEISKPPFYAVQLYPGDVGTFGGVMTDADGRVLHSDGSVIPGLYATGNSTASVMGCAYPGAGASIAASFVFGFLAAQHASTDVEQTSREEGGTRADR